VLSHAVLGGLLAAANGGSAAGGAVAGAGGELAAQAITKELYPKAFDENGDFHPEKLSTDQQNVVIALSSAVGAMLGGATGGTTQDALVGANVAANAATNNLLGTDSLAIRNAALAKLRKADSQGLLERIFDPMTGKMDSAKALVALNEMDRRSDELLNAWHQDPSSLSTAEKNEFAVYIAYYAQQNGTAAAEYLLKAGVSPTAESADVPALSQFADGLLRIQAVHDAQAAVGTPALSVLPGGLGAVIRMAQMAQAGEHFGTGVGQLSDGDASGLFNIGLGLLDATGVVLAQVTVASPFATGGKGANTVATSEGTANSATLQGLKGQLTNQNLANIAAQDSRLAAAVNGSGTSNPNFSVGSGTISEANQLGKIWVGDGAVITSDGSGMISADGTRAYRFPNEKNSTFATTGVQANFEIYTVNSVTGQRVKVSNGHLNVTN